MLHFPTRECHPKQPLPTFVLVGSTNHYYSPGQILPSGYQSSSLEVREAVLSSTTWAPCPNPILQENFPIQPDCHIFALSFLGKQSSFCNSIILCQVQNIFWEILSVWKNPSRIFTAVSTSSNWKEPAAIPALCWTESEATAVKSAGRTSPGAFSHGPVSCGFWEAPVSAPAGEPQRLLLAEQ